MSEPRKVVQLAPSQSGSLAALCNDGTVWVLYREGYVDNRATFSWHPAPPIPQADHA